MVKLADEGGGDRANWRTGSRLSRTSASAAAPGNRRKDRFEQSAFREFVVAFYGNEIT